MQIQIKNNGMPLWNCFIPQQDEKQSVTDKYNLNIILVERANCRVFFFN